jgi:hypothetical protein
MGASAGVLSRTGPRLGRRRPPAAATDRPKDNDPEKYIKDPFDVEPVNDETANDDDILSAKVLARIRAHNKALHHKENKRHLQELDDVQSHAGTWSERQLNLHLAEEEERHKRAATAADREFWTVGGRRRVRTARCHSANPSLRVLPFSTRARRIYGRARTKPWHIHATNSCRRSRSATRWRWLTPRQCECVTLPRGHCSYDC